MGKSKSKIYLSSPFFSKDELDVYKDVVDYLKDRYENVFVPRDHLAEAGRQSKNGWAERVFEIDRKGIDECDEVICLYWGMYSDTGTAWEVGYAYGKNKPVTIVLIDNAGIYSLMMINGCTKITTLNDFLSGKESEEINIVQC